MPFLHPIENFDVLIMLIPSTPHSINLAEFFIMHYYCIYMLIMLA